MKSISTVIKKVLSFRRQEFSEIQIPALKRDLVNLTGENFFESGKRAQLSPGEAEIFSNVFNWLLGNNIDVSLNKGLFLTGDYGTGKSALLKAIVSFIDKYYSDKATKNGIPSPIYTLSQAMANKFKDNDEVSINRMKTTPVLAIDDLGYEPKDVYYFGTLAHPFEEILMERYDRRRLVLISSNMNLDQIGERYGAHIKDRVKQMVYIIEFRGKSKRK